jgi:hypothetical protein
MFQHQSAIFKDMYFAYPEERESGPKHFEILHVMYKYWVHWGVILFNNTSEMQKGILPKGYNVKH